MMPQTHDRRSHVRGNFRYHVKFKTVTSEEFKARKTVASAFFSRDHKKLKFKLAETDTLLKALPVNGALSDFLLQMDAKLDRILALVSEDEEAHQGFKTSMGLDISASGMSIVTDAPLETGQIILARIVLSRLPYICIDVLAEINRVVRISEDDRDTYHLGVKFIDLDPGDRETIIACIFQKERASIRKRKEGVRYPDTLSAKGADLKRSDQVTDHI